jgi:hypothetical protein
MQDALRAGAQGDVARNMRGPALLKTPSRRVATVLCLAWLASAPFAFAQDAAQDTGSNTDLERAFEHCQAINDDAARLYCYKDAMGSERSASHREPAALGTWHFARTPNPTGGRPAVSIMQGADISKSDPGLAGLMLRCGDSATEVLIVLVHYLSPGALTTVTVAAGQNSHQFSGKVVAPGLLVLLPAEAMSLAAGPWQTTPELSVSVDDDGSAIKGVVPLTGLTGALQILQSNCPA